MAYTPGPWRWEGGEDLWHFGNGYECHGASDPHRYTGITIDKTLRDSEILHGNMALVAAAPELLGALEDTLNLAIQAMKEANKCGGAFDIDAERKPVEHLIAKAKGNE
jgi:hypothetical protein